MPCNASMAPAMIKFGTLAGRIVVNGESAHRGEVSRRRTRRRLNSVLRWRPRAVRCALCVSVLHPPASDALADAGAPGRAHWYGIWAAALVLSQAQSGIGACASLR